jgi:hypothetical protein
MFEELKKLFNRGGAGATPSHEREGSLIHPTNLKPWEDPSLAPVDRLTAYKEFVREKVLDIRVAIDRLGGDVSKTLEIRDAAETKWWMDEAKWVVDVSAEDFCERIDRTDVRKVVGKNFLGAEEWEAQKIEVGEVPPIPSSITKALLTSPCPLHAKQLIKETHVLMLVPRTVNGEAYTALKLEELCATRKGSGDRLLHSGLERWKGQPWANLPQAQSEWVLLPKSDPDSTASPDKHFRSKKIAEQADVHRDH